MRMLCGNCGTEFQAKPSLVAKGGGKFCSLACRSLDCRNPARVRARFDSYVDVTGPVLVAELGPCHVWTGGKYADGYGQLRVAAKTELAHRVAWWLTHGRWPNPQALHKCDGGSIGCVRIDHLFEGTNADNMADKTAKGRARGAPPGEQSPTAKLKEVHIPLILAAAEAGESHRSIGERFGVTQPTISSLLRGETWSHVTGRQRAS